MPKRRFKPESPGDAISVGPTDGADRSGGAEAVIAAE
jgi:hypothetical protein